MKLLSKDTVRLAALRRKAEDPATWRSMDDDRLMSEIGRERFGELVRNATSAPDGTRILSFKKEDAQAISKSFRGDQHEASLAHDVTVLFDIRIVAGHPMMKHASCSRRGSRLPERYVRDVAVRLGFGPTATVEQNPSSGVWHVHERMGDDA